MEDEWEAVWRWVFYADEICWIPFLYHMVDGLWCRNHYWVVSRFLIQFSRTELSYCHDDMLQYQPTKDEHNIHNRDVGFNKMETRGGRYGWPQGVQDWANLSKRYRQILHND